MVLRGFRLPSGESKPDLINLCLGATNLDSVKSSSSLTGSSREGVQTRVRFPSKHHHPTLSNGKKHLSRGLAPGARIPPPARALGAMSEEGSTYDLDHEMLRPDVPPRKSAYASASSSTDLRKPEPNLAKGSILKSSLSF